MCVLHGCDLFPTPEASSDARQRNAHCFSPICTYRAVYEADSEEEEEEEEDQDEASNSDVSNDDGGGGRDEESGPSSTKPKASARKTAAVPTKKGKGKDVSEDEEEEEDVAEPSEEEEDDLLVSNGQSGADPVARADRGPGHQDDVIGAPTSHPGYHWFPPHPVHTGC